MTHLSLKSGMKQCKVKGRASDKSEMKQLHFRYTSNPKHYKEINEEQKKLFWSPTCLSNKIDGTIKGRTVAGRDKQKDFISKEYPRSPTVTTEAVLLSCIIDVE